MKSEQEKLIAQNRQLEDAKTRISDDYANLDLTKTRLEARLVDQQENFARERVAYIEDHEKTEKDLLKKNEHVQLVLQRYVAGAKTERLRIR